MSLMSPRLIVSCAAASFAALTLASCSQQATPTSPSTLAAAGAVQPIAEYWVTLFDETPAPPAPGAPPPSGSPPSPWPPGPPPNAMPGIPVPTPPSTHPRVSIRVDPEPVQHSGVPVPVSGCSNLPYTWYYDQHLHAETGVRITFTERENFFDGRFASRNTQTIDLPGNGTVVLHTRWCSGYARPHYTQTRFKGVDEQGEKVEISGPWVRLLTP